MNLRSPANYLNSLWNWTVYNDCFAPTPIRITDVDGLVERNGYFLLLETKRPTEKIPTGQAILFDALCRDPKWNVLIIWGEANRPVQWRLWRYQKVYTGGVEELKTFIGKWFLFAESIKQIIDKDTI